jgi:hypothetical protein
MLINYFDMSPTYTCYYNYLSQYTNENIEDIFIIFGDEFFSYKFCILQSCVKQLHKNKTFAYLEGIQCKNSTTNIYIPFWIIDSTKTFDYIFVYLNHDIKC